MDVDENEPTEEANLNFASQFIQEASQNVDLGFNSRTVLPGDDITDVVSGFRKSIKIGDGIVKVKDQVRVSIAGKVKYRAPASYWIEGSRKKYQPKEGDQIVGVIEERGGDFYRVNIFSGSSAILNKLSFEGATKRNKPELKKGDVIYARVTLAHKDLDTELSCMSSSGPKKEWSSGETVYGELPEGLLVRISLGQSRSMLKPDSIVLNALGKHFAYEVAVGMNGATWLQAASPIESVVIRNAILNAQLLNDLETEAMVDLLAQRAKSG